jgi:hypothetical protein
MIPPAPYIKSEGTIIAFLPILSAKYPKNGIAIAAGSENNVINKLACRLVIFISCCKTGSAGTSMELPKTMLNGTKDITNSTRYFFLVTSLTSSASIILNIKK